MKRIKVINEPTELVPMFRAVDTKVKREVLKEVTANWCTMAEIEEKFGKEGKEALIFFEKMKLVESMWQTSPAKSQEKTYHSYYVSFHINTSCPVHEISDVLAIAIMDEDVFIQLETKILELIGEEGRFAGDVSEELELTTTMLKSVVKRSIKLEYRGHRIDPVKEEDTSLFGR